MAIVITADGNTITDQIRPNEFAIEQNITSKVDQCQFRYRKYGSRTYVPDVGHVVSVTDGGSKVFEGTIIEIKEKVQGKNILVFDIRVKDYTDLLDQTLIAETYEERTVKYIIDDFVTNWLPAGITGNNVESGADLTEIEFIQFDYARPSDAIRDLADMIGYDWWIDYDKDLHFQPKGAVNAPFDLTDTNEKYDYNSLELRKSDKQIRNTIYITGADYVAASTTDKIGEGDGNQKRFPLPYKYDSLPTVTVNSVSQTVGVDFLDDPASFDVLWNRQEKVLNFYVAPTSGHAIEVTGDPLVPLFVKLTAPGSVASKGSYEFKLTDKTLKTQAAVRQRAQAELDAYADSIGEGSFITHEGGLEAGQRIYITSAIRGITNQDYVIQQVITTLHTPTEFIYKVKLAKVKAYEIVELLRQLLREGEKTLGIIRDANSVLNLISSLTEVDGVECDELLEVNGYKVDLTAIDNANADDTLLNAGIDDPPTWVYGQYHPTGDADRKRSPMYGRGARYG